MKRRMDAEGFERRGPTRGRAIPRSAPGCRAQEPRQSPRVTDGQTIRRETESEGKFPSLGIQAIKLRAQSPFEKQVWSITVPQNPNSQSAKPQLAKRPMIQTAHGPLAGDPQAENDLPQPQLLWALGLLILKPPPVSASLKSMTEPRM
jgi:hypothetical protein